MASNAWSRNFVQSVYNPKSVGTVNELGWPTCFIIKNFKHITEWRIPFEPPLTLFIGPNNSGKTTVLLALTLFLDAYSKINENKYWGKADVVHSSFYDNLFASLQLQENCAPSERQLFRRGTATFIMEFANCIITITRGVQEMSGTITGTVSAPSKLPLVFVPAGFHVPTKEATNQETSYFPHLLRQRLYRIFQFPENKTILVNILQSLYPETTIDVHEAKLQSGQKIEMIYVCEVTVGGKTIEIAEAGFGYVEVVLALVAILDPDKAGFILLDEFLSHIHWDLAAKFVEVLVKLAGDFVRYTKRVVVAATHNPAVVPLVPVSHVIHFSSNGPERVGGSDKVSILSSFGLPLKFQPGNTVITAATTKRILLVEGKTEMAIVPSLFPINDKIAVFQCAGRPTVQDVTTVLQAVSNMDTDTTKPIKIAILCDRDFRVFTQSVAVEQAQYDKILSQFPKLNCQLRLWMWEMYEVENHLIGSVESFAKFVNAYDPGKYATPPTTLLKKKIREIFESQLPWMAPLTQQYAIDHKITDYYHQMGQMFLKSSDDLFPYIKGKRLLAALLGQERINADGSYGGCVIPPEVYQQLQTNLDPSITNKLNEISAYLTS